MYTYSKMKDKSFNRASFMSGVVMPRARLRCGNGKDGRGTVIGNGKPIPSSTPLCNEPDQDRVTVSVQPVSTATIGFGEGGKGKLKGDFALCLPIYKS